MGYTHYWEDIVVNEALADTAQLIIEESDVAICGWDGNGSPLVSAEKISLNGSEADGDDFETFTLEGTSNDFCKTGERPYDEVVTAILVAAILMDNGKVESDGTYEDWEAGIALYERAMPPILTDAERAKIKAMLAR